MPPMANRSTKWPGKSEIEVWVVFGVKYLPDERFQTRLQKWLRVAVSPKQVGDLSAERCVIAATGSNEWLPIGFRQAYGRSQISREEGLNAQGSTCHLFDLQTVRSHTGPEERTRETKIGCSG